MAYPFTSRIIRFLCSPFLGECTGLENIPSDQGALLAANHASYLDHIVIGSNLIPKLNRMIYFLAKKEHFSSFLQRRWHEYFRAIPIDREAGGQEALKKAIEHLKDGDLVVIYPEGTRTLTGEMNRARTGVARLILSARVPVIPMGITNTFHILPKGKKIPRLGKKADLHIGNPLRFDKYYGRNVDRGTLRDITTNIMKEIARLSGQKYEFE
jgi:1-acyl-sn-glycerol-3-phosphate acyltransferase